MIKVVILDFDGTLVTRDILDVLCGIMGKEQESRKINDDYHAGKLTGIIPLIQRINLLKGLQETRIALELQNKSYLMPGARELIDFLHKHAITTILASGNIIQVLAFYQNLLNIDYIVGSRPHVKNGVVTRITRADYPSPDFKLIGVRKIVESLQITEDETLVIGDSPADKSLFLYAKYSVAINPKGDIEKSAHLVIHDSLSHAIPYIEKHLIR